MLAFMLALRGNSGASSLTGAIRLYDFTLNEMAAFEPLGYIAFHSSLVSNDIPMPDSFTLVAPMGEAKYGPWVRTQTAVKGLGSQMAQAISERYGEVTATYPYLDALEATVQALLDSGYPQLLADDEQTIISRKAVWPKW